MWLGGTIVTTCPHLPSPMPLRWPTFPRHPWRRRKHWEGAPRLPFLLLPHNLFSEWLSEERWILLPLLQTPEQSLTALAPWSILRCYLGSAAACSSFCQDALPTMHLFFNLSLSPSLSVLCPLSLSLFFSLSLSLHTLQLHRERKTFQLLAKSNTKSLSYQSCLCHLETCSCPSCGTIVLFFFGPSCVCVCVWSR